MLELTKSILIWLMCQYQIWRIYGAVVSFYSVRIWKLAALSPPWDLTGNTWINLVQCFMLYLHNMPRFSYQILSGCKKCTNLVFTPFQLFYDTCWHWFTGKSIAKFDIFLTIIFYFIYFLLPIRPPSWIWLRPDFFTIYLYLEIISHPDTWHTSTMTNGGKLPVLSRLSSPVL